MKASLLGLLIAPLLLADQIHAQPTTEAQDSQPNVLLIVVDDIGVEQLNSYGTGVDLPVTPRLDTLAAASLRFTNAWASPVCTPSRVNLLTGRFGFRTGFGTGMFKGGNVPLPYSEVLIPELLDAGGSGYSHAAIGKWHVSPGTPAYYDSPGEHGFSHFAGIMDNPGQPGYYSWRRIEDGVAAQSSEFITSNQVDSALAWIATTTGPWFCYLALTSAHSPYPRPPAGTYTEDLSGLSQEIDLRPHYKATIENLDFEIGRLFDSLGSALDDTVVIFVSDNGTPQNVIVAPFDPLHGKRTVYQQGVQVPLMVSGPGVANPGRTEDTLVHIVDLFATVLELAGVDVKATLPSSVTIDSFSLVPLLEGSASGRAGIRRVALFSEFFSPNGGVPTDLAMRTTRGQRYKLIRFDFYDEFYDLQMDPLEINNLLLGQLDRFEFLNYQLLGIAMNQILGS